MHYLLHMLQCMMINPKSPKTHSAFGLESEIDWLVLERMMIARRPC